VVLWYANVGKFLATLADYIGRRIKGLQRRSVLSTDMKYRWRRPPLLQLPGILV
jgi:hypothetical protein